jgi:hypothetical protein
MKSTSVPESICLNCGHRLDCVGSLTEETAPSAGDVTLCINCSHIMLFTNELRLRNPTPAELDAISKQDEVFATLAALARLRRDCGPFE